MLWAQQAEGALNIEDVLERRTRISLVPGDSALVNETVSALLDKSNDDCSLGVSDEPE